MLDPIETIRTYINTKTAIKTAVGTTRIYSCDLPDAIIGAWKLESDVSATVYLPDAEFSIDGVTPEAVGTVNIWCFGPSITSAQSLATTVNGQLDGTKHAVVGAINLHYLDLESGPAVEAVDTGGILWNYVRLTYAFSMLDTAG